MISMDKKYTALTVHYRMTRRDIFIGSLHYLYIVGLFLLFMSIFYKIDKVFSLNTPIIQLIDAVTQSIFYVLIFIFVLAVSVICIGIIILYIKYRNYEIASDEDFIYVQNGDKMQIMIPQNALQSIAIEKSLKQGPFHFVKIKVHYRAEINNSRAIHTESLLPFIHERDGKQIIEEIQPDFVVDDAFLSLSGEAYFVELIQPSYVLVIVTFFIMFFWPELWFLPILCALYLIVKRIMKTKQQQVSWSNNVIAIRNGAFSSALHTIKREQITLLQIQQSWIQRKLKVATCQLTVENNTLVLIHLNEAIIEQLYNWFIQDDLT